MKSRVRDEVRVRENQPSRPRGVFGAVLLDLGQGGLVVTQDPELENVHNFPLFMSYPSARRTGRALSALALPYKMGGQWVDLSLG